MHLSGLGGDQQCNYACSIPKLPFYFFKFFITLIYKAVLLFVCLFLISVPSVSTVPFHGSDSFNFMISIVQCFHVFRILSSAAFINS